MNILVTTNICPSLRQQHERITSRLKEIKKSSPNTFCGLRPSARWLVAVSEALRRVFKPRINYPTLSSSACVNLCTASL